MLVAFLITLPALLALAAASSSSNGSFYVGISITDTSCYIGALNSSTSQLELIPSFPPSISYSPTTQRLLVGHEAVTAAAAADPTEMDVVFVNAKGFFSNEKTDGVLSERLKEMNMKDPATGDVVHSREGLYAILLKHLVCLGERQWKRRPTHAIVTVPRSWTDERRRSVERASKMANLPIRSIIDEDVAVATAFGIFKARHSKTVLVYNQGPNSFEASILNQDDGLLDSLAFITGPLPTTTSSIASEIFSTLLNKANLTHSEIDDVYISANTKVILPSITVFAKRPKFFNDKTLARGAVMHADRMRRYDSQGPEGCFPTFMPASLGVETTSGYFAPILLKDSVVPAWKSREFKIGAGDKKKMMRVLAGEDGRAAMNKVIAEIDLSSFMPAANVHVAFQIQDNNQLQVAIYDPSSGLVKSLELEFDVQYNSDIEEGLLDVGGQCVVEKEWIGEVYEVGV
ncbi:hypothetical protein HDV05_005057 [Chytridiales sp. JEL 0842]|nr:hypothetical protein HDV05_005057 [Chytridiales sp. JEL 0842]